MSKENIQFKAEVSQVLNLVINSLYSHHEIFLRELISNAADAIDKHRYLSLTDEKYKKPDAPYGIRIIPDKKAKTLTIADNGIGMTRQEVIDNIGTIASSGSRAFWEGLKDNKENLQLIGQFGVGFYSAFMVAQKVTLATRRAGQEEAAVLWSSDGTGGYTIEETELKNHGTEVTLYLKDDAAEYLDEWKIKEVVKKYSDYVPYPITLKDEKGGEETVNKVTAIWARPKTEITEEEYREFYKYISHDTEDPLVYSHHVMEGSLQYKMLLYIPEKAPMHLLMREDMHGVRLHVKRMFITDDCKEFVPVYLRFVRGVVDSEDLPLNVSREMLQHNAVMTKIRKQLIRKVFDMLDDLSKKDPVKYRKFFSQMGVTLKEGLVTDFENRETLLELLRFQSTRGASAEDLISLGDYADAMKSGQKDIYYICGPNREACERSPHLEIFRKKDIEVLFFADVIDEWLAPAIGEYKGKKLKSITKGDLDLGDLDKDKEKELKDADAGYQELKDTVRALLQDNVKEVRLTNRLDESPCCLVADEADMEMHMEQVMRALGKEVEPAKRILELNPNHPVIKNMRTVLEKNKQDERLKGWARLLYNQALLAEGQPLKNPAEYVKAVNELLTAASTEAAK